MYRPLLLLLALLLVACVGERSEDPPRDTRTSTTLDTGSGVDTTEPTDTAGEDTEEGDAGGDADTASQDTGGVDTTPPPPTEIALDQLDEAFGSAYCDIMEGCLLGEDDFRFFQIFLLGGGDRAFCEDIGASLLRDELTGIKALIEAGKVIYDAEAAVACVETWASGCIYAFAMNDPWEDACANMLKGTVPVGGTCHDSLECAGDNYCDHSDPASGSYLCPGRCASRSDLGEVCDRDSQCQQAGLLGFGSCERPSTVGAERRCADNRLAPDRAGQGEPCGRNFDETANVVLWTECSEGLACTNPNGDGVCVLPLQPGSSCGGVDELCSGDEVCLPELQNPDRNKCQDLEIVNETGGACVAEFDASGPVCNLFRGLSCVNGACARPGDGTLGAPCERQEFASLSCNEGLYCDPTSDACLAKKGVKETCRSSTECLSNSCQSGSCAELRCD